MCVHVWIPDYEASLGGIQTFTKFFVRGLGECLPDAAFSLVCKNDNSFPSLPARRGRTFFYGSGWCPQFFRTPVFTTQLLYHALREQPDMVLSTHVNFTPVAQALNSLN